jgi:hypothetical protein
MTALAKLGRVSETRFLARVVRMGVVMQSAIPIAVMEG